MPFEIRTFYATPERRLYCDRCIPETAFPATCIASAEYVRNIEPVCCTCGARLEPDEEAWAHPARWYWDPTQEYGMQLLDPRPPAPPRALEAILTRMGLLPPAESPHAPEPFPADWLQRRMTVEEVEAEEARRAAVLHVEIPPALSFPPPTEAVPEPPSRIVVLAASMREGDELWSYSSPPETWEMLFGRAGYVVLRDGLAVADVQTMMN